jgi:hypothetical protein
MSDLIQINANDLYEEEKNARLIYRIFGTSFIVNVREYSAGFCILTQGNFGKCVEPCFRSIVSSSNFKPLESNQ